MLKNYLLTSFRRLARQRTYTLINVLGLALGITSCLLIFLYVAYELGFDRYLARADRIVRIETAGWATTPMAVGPFLQETRPEVERSARFLRVNRALVGTDQQMFSEKRFFFADSTVFFLFSVPFLEGEPGSALNVPNALVLTRTMAAKYFGAAPALGRRLTVQTNRTTVFTVTGVVEDLPPQSHFHFDFLASWATLPDPGRNNRALWEASTSYTYLLLRPGTDAPALARYASSALTRHSTAADTSSIDVRLRPLTDIHLYAEVEKEIEPAGGIRAVLILAAVACVILLLAVINFVNLTTAQSLKRIREIGVRKTLGAARSQLVLQFVLEAVLLALAASLTALVTVSLVLPAFNALTGSGLTLSQGPGLVVLVLLPLAALLLGALAGGYPALFLSGFHLASVLKPAAGPKGARPALLRKLLVVVQFTISIALLSGSLLIARQLDFIQNRDLGLRQDQVVVMPISTINTERYSTLKSELLRTGTVHAVAASFDVPGERIVVEEFHPQNAREPVYYTRILLGDAGVPETFGFTVRQGRAFAESFPSDTAGAFMLNEKAAALFGWTDPLGKRVEFPSQHRAGEVVGIVRDFHYASLHTEIEPLVIHLDQNPALYKYISVRVGGTDKRAALQRIEQVWKSVLPGLPFEYYFLDESFAALYRTESTLRSIVGAFTLMAVLIASLGLLGLVTQSVTQRTKEIGIRKVLGASTTRIVTLLSRDFLLLVGLAGLLASPLAYFAMQRWLDGFAYRIEISIGVFLVAVGVALCAALLAVGTQTVRAARANPVDSLRYE